MVKLASAGRSPTFAISAVMFTVLPSNGFKSSMVRFTTVKSGASMYTGSIILLLDSLISNVRLFGSTATLML